MTAEADAAASAWLDRFFAAYYRRRPVDATFIGVHDYDDRLPDLSAGGVADLVSEMEGLLATCPVPSSVLSPQSSGRAAGGASVLDVDCALAADFLAIQIAECRSGHFWDGNPCHYTGEAVFGVMSLFLREYAPLQERSRAAVARLRAVPALLAQGRANLGAAPPAWVARAVRECEGALHFLGAGIDRLIADYGLGTPGLREAADGAAAAFVAFRDWLRDDLATRPTGGYAAGSDFFDLLMRRGHHLDRDGAAIAAYAREVFAEEEEGLRRGAEEFGVPAGDWRAALARLADARPTAEGYLDRYREGWAAARRAAIEHDLVTWPDFPIAYQPFPAWARGAQPYLYFLHYRAPGPFDLPRVPVHPYLVTPVEPLMPAEERARTLRATNDAVIKANHVIHHGGLGHHLQNWHAARAASRVGRIAATDCASRIAFFSGGTMAEGWACYATGLMAEIGFLTPLERFAERHARLRMAARAICDVGIHDGSLGLADVAALYRDRVGMAPAAAEAEAVKNAMFPGAAMIYLIGTDAIRDLRATLAARDGPAFRLRAFHDRFLAHGSLPVPLIARLMTGDHRRDAETQRCAERGDD
jgi:hypothetical protein